MFHCWFLFFSLPPPLVLENVLAQISPVSFPFSDEEGLFVNYPCVKKIILKDYKRTEDS